MNREYNWIFRASSCSTTNIISCSYWAKSACLRHVIDLVNFRCTRERMYCTQYVCVNIYVYLYEPISMWIGLDWMRINLMVMAGGWQFRYSTVSKIALSVVAHWFDSVHTISIHATISSRQYKFLYRLTT